MALCNDNPCPVEDKEIVTPIPSTSCVRVCGGGVGDGGIDTIKEGTPNVTVVDNGDGSVTLSVANTTLSAGQNITLNETTNADGSKNYEVSAAGAMASEPKVVYINNPDIDFNALIGNGAYAIFDMEPEVLTEAFAKATTACGTPLTGQLVTGWMFHDTQSSVVFYGTITPQNCNSGQLLFMRYAVQGGWRVAKVEEIAAMQSDIADIKTTLTTYGQNIQNNTLRIQNLENEQHSLWIATTTLNLSWLGEGETINIAFAPAVINSYFGGITAGMGIIEPVIGTVTRDQENTTWYIYDLVLPSTEPQYPVSRLYAVSDYTATTSNNLKFYAFNQTTSSKFAMVYKKGEEISGSWNQASVVLNAGTYYFIPFVGSSSVVEMNLTDQIIGFEDGYFIMMDDAGTIVTVEDPAQTNENYYAIGKFGYLKGNRNLYLYGYGNFTDIPATFNRGVGVMLSAPSTFSFVWDDAENFSVTGGSCQFLESDTAITRNVTFNGEFTFMFGQVLYYDDNMVKSADASTLPTACHIIGTMLNINGVPTVSLYNGLEFTYEGA